MRGKGKDYQLGDKVSRITPAYAGKRQTGDSDAVKIMDHPRLCGEKAPDLSLMRGMLGSPPPMRGKVDPVCV